jgi:EAL and modified HD-GYP domain-containing signal transduction protein
LVYRLLRISNSAAAGVNRKVSTVREALVLVGMSRLRAWLVLLSMSPHGAGTDTMVDALTRARTCEQVARTARLSSPEVAFTAGLLHGVAESLGLAPIAMLERMPALGSELAEALFGRPGPLRDVLDCVIAYERQDLAALAQAPVPLKTMADAYLGALAWTTETTRATSLVS